MSVYRSHPSAPDPMAARPRTAGSAQAHGRIPAQRGTPPVGGNRRTTGAGKAGKTGKGSKNSRSAGSPGQRARRRDPLWARLILILGAVLMVVSGGIIAGSKALISQATKNINQEDILGGAGKTESEGGANMDGPIDLLLLGIDHRERWSKDDARADTIITLHIPASHDQAYLLSIPRDTQAQIPPDKRSGYGGGTDKINAAFFFGAQRGRGWAGGTQLLASTITNMTGIKFDGAAIINFGGFSKIIDALGSVRMCVDQEVESHHIVMVDGKHMYLEDAKKLGRGGAPPVVYKKGCREMAGWQALDYARQRYGLPNSDYDRQRHQQQLLKAMAKKAMTQGMSDPLKLNKLLKAAGDALILDTNKVPIADFLFTLRGVAANDLVLLRTNGGTFYGNGHGKELLSGATQAMFRAVRDDNLGNFILYNPEVVVPNSAGR